MSKSILFLLFFVSFSLVAQDDFLIGKWDFEKIPDDFEMDEYQKEMTPKMFGDMSVSFDKKNFRVSMMGGVEIGTWKVLDDDTYKLNSEGIMQGATVKKISDNQLILKPAKGEIQLIKSGDVVPKIDESEFLSINGHTVKKEALYGKWYYNGQKNDVLDDRLNNMIPEHKKGEPINYTFQADGKLISRGIKGKSEIGSWSIDTDNQTLNIKSKELTGAFEIVRLDDSQFYYHYPELNTVIKFIRHAGPIDDDYLFGSWVFDKIPAYKGLNKQEQEMAMDIFGKTTIVLKKNKYVASIGGEADKGTWKSLTNKLIEFQSSKGHSYEIGTDKISSSQVLFTFNGTIELVMKKSGK